MALKFYWVNENLEPLDGIEVYYSNSPTGPFVLRDTVDGGQEFYEDEQIPRNTIGYYKLISISGGFKTESAVRAFGYFPAGTGPGFSEILRGGWGFGYMGEIPTADLPGYAELRTKIALQPSTAGAANAKFHKWSVGNKIVFIPELPYNEGAIYSSASQCRLALGADPASGITIQRGDNLYGWRYPYATTKATAASLTDGSFVIGAGGMVSTTDATFPNSEVAALYASFQNITGFHKERFLDILPVANTAYLLSNTYFRSAGTDYNIAVTPMNIPTASLAYFANVGTGVNMWPILELLLD